MTDSPYKPSELSTPPPVYRFPAKLFWWFGLVVVLICFALVAVLWGCVVADSWSRWGVRKSQVVVTCVATVLFSFIGIPHYLSVFRRSIRFARWVVNISLIGMWISVATVVIYPVCEYYFDNSPPGFELLGIVFYSGIASLFYLNQRLHKRWLVILQKKHKWKRSVAIVLKPAATS